MRTFARMLYVCLGALTSNLAYADDRSVLRCELPAACKKIEHVGIDGGATHYLQVFVTCWGGGDIVTYVTLVGQPSISKIVWVRSGESKLQCRRGSE